ncbi:hypothetical protein SBA7_400010 [Candidatus Sulfotelmatobacter sp. SbA7]|jgi:hypothetical protein|nr:hypothetical protein SBA7_400010 [Candidatus Sulfotelmatobacter sp. SbA7]
MPTATDLERDRKAAGKFLEGLKEHLNNKIYLPEVREWIQNKEESRPTGKDVQYEQLFTDTFVLPAIPEYLGKALSLSPNDERVRSAFLAESNHAKKQEWTSDSPRSANKYLFTKVFGANSKSVVKSWWKESKKGQTCQSCPDWAFRAPCPHAVVFEGKFFRKGGIDAARRELVGAVYQCFYYLAHPQFPPTNKHPAWDYKYACLFAYDASKERSLVNAWETLNKEVREACWGGASNIFVIVLPEK